MIPFSIVGVVIFIFYVWHERTLERLGRPDDLPQLDNPVVTLSLIGLCVGVFVYQNTVPAYGAAEVIAKFGTIPALVTGRYETNAITAEMGLTRPRAILSLLTSAFVHNDVFHLLGNTVFLWIFGRHLDDLMDWYIFIPFVLVSILVSSLATVLIYPQFPYPVIGASGFVASLMGAYLVLFPRAKLYQYWRLPFIMTRFTFALPAWFYLIVWIALQLYFFFDQGLRPGGVEFTGHIAGFATGALLGWCLHQTGYLASYAPDPPSSQA